MSVEPAPVSDAAALVRRAAIKRMAMRAGAPMPDALMALFLLGYALMQYVDWSWPVYLYGAIHDEQMMMALFFEGTFLFLQVALVDIATRLRTPVPALLIPIIGGLLILFIPGARVGVITAWQQGSVVFIPLLISMIDRMAILARMPQRTPVEKMAARALIGNRLICAVPVALLFLIRSDFGAAGTLLFLAAALYFGIAAYDEWRVRGRRFAANPRVLFRWDYLGVRELDSSPL